MIGMRNLKSCFLFCLEYIVVIGSKLRFGRRSKQQSIQEPLQGHDACAVLFSSEKLSPCHSLGSTSCLVRGVCQ